MNNRKIIRNGLVLTFDKDGSCGYFNIVLNDGKIAEVDKTGKLTDEYIISNYADAEIIDAKGKIILPGFINSNLNSSTRLSKIFFKRNIYDSLASNISLDLLTNYFKSPKNAQDMYMLFAYSLSKSLLEGETTLVEISEGITREFYTEMIEGNSSIVQDIMMCANDSTLNDNLTGKKFRHFVRFGREDNVTTYSLNALKKYVDDANTMVCCDVLNSEKAVTEIKSTFGKSPIKIFADYGILTEKMFFSNPIYLKESDLELLKEKKAGIVFNTSDYIKLGKNRVDMNMVMDEGIRVVIGTGYLGNNILSELMTFGSLFYTPKLKYSNLMKMALTNPASYLGLNGKGVIASNKDADLVFIDVSGLKNFMSLPETDQEKVSEFVIENLNASDIVDVMKAGEFAVRKRELAGEPVSGIVEEINDLSEEIFRAGNYFEFKERYMMKKRVDELSLDKRKDYSNIPLTDTEVTIGVDDGFKIIGVKKSEDYAKERPLFEHQRKKNVYIQEVKSFRKGLSLYPTKVSEEIVYDEFTEEKSEVKEKPEVNSSVEKPAEVKEGAKKMKFGFSEGEE
jgi:5-methylthioadenosine/S-adenosylhomocysteine deaminase